MLLGSGVSSSVPAAPGNRLSTVPVTEHDKLPDVVLYLDDKGRAFEPRALEETACPTKTFAPSSSDSAQKMKP